MISIRSRRPRPLATQWNAPSSAQSQARWEAQEVEMRFARQRQPVALGGHPGEGAKEPVDRALQALRTLNFAFHAPAFHAGIASRCTLGDVGERPIHGPQPLRERRRQALLGQCRLDDGTVEAHPEHVRGRDRRADALRPRSTTRAGNARCPGASTVPPGRTHSCSRRSPHRPTPRYPTIVRTGTRDARARPPPQRRGPPCRGRAGRAARPACDRSSRSRTRRGQDRRGHPG